MIRLQEPELQPTDDHSAWQATWNGDERQLVNVPCGYWYDLVNISMVKRLLQQEMPLDERLRFLEYLNISPRGMMTLEAMQVITPACDVTMKMLDEMNPLTIDDKCRLMRKWNVIAAFINLNTSILDAIKLFSIAAPRAA